MAYVQPSRSDVHVDRPLTTLSVAFFQAADSFISDRVFPAIPVNKQSDLYFTWDRGNFNRDEMQLRAPSTESAGATYTVSTDSYRCATWALHRDIDDQVRANADSPIDLNREAMEFLTLKALIRREKAWATTNFTTSVWTTDQTGVAATPTTNEFLQWNDALSTPIEDIRASKRFVQESTGFRPNKLVVGREVYDTLLDHPDFVGRLDRGQTTGAAIVMRQNVAELFEIDEVLVMDSIENTAAEGATNVHAFIGGRSALLVYSAPRPGLYTPSGGYTFLWTGLLGAGVTGQRLNRMRVPLIKSDRIEIEQSFDHKIVSADLGQFFATAVA